MLISNTAERAVKHRGLSDKDVRRSREQYGDNHLIRHKKHSFIGEFIRNFGDPIIKILLIALTVNIVISLRHFNWFESAGIALAILISTFVSTLSEYGSEAAFDKLQEEALKTSCRVVRDSGLVEVPVGDVVVGDTVLLQAGDRIPADGIIINGELLVDQSPLNGESREAVKRPGGSEAGDGNGFSCQNRLFRGCVVCSGEAVLRVTAVGAGTFYGGLAREIQEAPRESPLKLRLSKLARAISRFGYIGAVLVAGADLFHSFVLSNGGGLDAIVSGQMTPQELIGCLVHAATLAISIIVVAIPEGLPLMITIVLSSNMKRMLKDNVLVRKLVGIETAGNLTILFTDKTGTLTRGQLRVTCFIGGDGTKTHDFAKIRHTEPGRLLRLNGFYNTAAALGTEGGKRHAIGGNATERALLDFVASVEVPDEKVRAVSSVPFSSAAKYSAVQLEGGVKLTLYKGAPELLLPRCTSYIDAGGVKRTLPRAGVLEKTMAASAAEAVRLLAVAVADEALNPEGLGGNMTLVGVVGIRDEVRPEAAKAIRQVKSAGIQVVMITGDNKETAAAVARDVGLISAGQEGAVLTSAELQRLSDQELGARLSALRVVARAVPSDKTRLIALAQVRGLVAGMTGDGINDAPALKKADVGFAMGSGTEVAKEAGDIVILDDNFLSIAKAVLFGRTIFKSIRKFIIFQLTINLCAVAVSVIGPFIGFNSPITVIQMLWVNMVMDTLAGLAFAGEAPLKEYMQEPPKRRDEPIINRYMAGQILLGGLYSTLLCVLFLKLPAIGKMYGSGADNTYLMTAFFAMFIFAGVFNSFNARTTRLNLLAYIWRNKGFLAIMLLVTVVQLVIIYYGGAIFRTTGLRYPQLQFVLLLAFTVIPVDFLRKLFTGSAYRGSAI